MMEKHKIWGNSAGEKSADGEAKDIGKQHRRKKYAEW